MRPYSIKTKCLIASFVALALAGCGGSDSPETSTTPAANLAALRAAGNTVSTVPLAATEPIHVALVLKLNNETDLDSFLKQSRTRGSTNFGAVLTSAQVAAQYAPTSQQVAMVKAYLQNNGFTNIKVADNNMMVEADAPTNVVSSVFKTTLASVAMADGTRTHVNTTSAIVPNEISAVAGAVLGLDTATRLHTHSVRSSVATSTQNASAPAPGAVTVGHNPTTFPAIYSVGNTPAASNVTVGIIAEGNLSQPLADLTTFTNNNQLPAVPVSVVNAGTPSGDTSGNSEWSLDSQSIVGMSGGVKQLNFYVASSFAWSDMAAAINRAVSDNSARVINMSIGGCESSAPTASIDQILKLAVAQGQTFSVSTGDSGSVAYGCSGTSVEYPASSPYVVAVGGTTLYTNGDGSYAGETAWASGGGGISVVEPIPSWQSKVSQLNGRTYRGLPDLALDADPNSGAAIVVGGQLQTWGGTSLAAPLFAATWARTLSGNCSTTLGFAAPTLYNVEATSPSIFRDITYGSNGAYSSGAGWDFVTGWGSPSVNAMYSATCVPTIYGGNISGGTILSPGQVLYSPSKNHELVMQNDGNLVLYNVSNGAPLWNSGTVGNAGAYAAFQTDGNLVVYSASGTALWFSSTSSTSYGQYLAVQDDGNMVIYEVQTPVFATNTATAGWSGSNSLTVWGGGVSIGSGQNFTSGNGANVLVMQSDGNLVLYRQGVSQWSSGTYGHSGAYAVMQSDGNLVVYSADHTTPLWNSNTSGHSGAVTLVQDDGNVVIYPQVPHWNTGTMGR